ncbi:oplophorus-luciferin 2-monooxygenase non-catalytic subunit [Procambarus clarkii]|uniref:oplophorus-luciferin 2-monooxygenase non-catalytic subunit n=1 Tax=Procambarus clarkii TaxID=6728 RepID=UPI003744368C
MWCSQRSQTSFTPHVIMRNSALLPFLLLLAAAASSAVPPHSLARLGAWPCPSEEEVAPCTCYADDDLNLFVDCQNLPDLATLTGLFLKPFQFKKFFRLQVSDSKFDGETLTADVFNGFTFREVIMFNNNLKAVDTEAFSASINDLTIFEFSDPDTVFTIDVLIDFVELRELVLAVDCSSIKNLASDSLISVTIRCSNNITLAVNSLNLTALTTLHLRKSHLTSVGTGNFWQSPLLQTLTLNENLIKTFDSDALNFTSLLELDLSGNLLTEMPNISGMQSGGEVNIGCNVHLKQLSQINTQPLLDNNVKIVATNVSLACDCDLQWLLGENDTDMLLTHAIEVDIDCLEDDNYSTIRDILKNFC